MGEIAIVENRPLTKGDIIAQKRLIQEVMESVMKEGTHYGTIPGCKQPSLWKAGSETILSTFRIAVEPSVEDLSTFDCFRYRVTLRGVIPSGEIVGAGIGECSTDEEKYHWRGAVSDKEFDATPEDRRRIKYNKSWEAKQVRTNPADLANTVLKMAKKRAQIDLTLTATGASDVFAQDLEDLPEEIRDELVGEQQQRQGKPSTTPPKAKTESSADGTLINQAQINIILGKLKNKGAKESDFCTIFKIKEVKDLPFSEFSRAQMLINAGEIGVVVDAKQEYAPGEDNEKIKCKNCGEMIDPIQNTGHLLDCSLAG